MYFLCIVEALVYSVLACSSLMSQYFAVVGFSPFQIGLLMALPPLTSIYANYIYFDLAKRLSARKLIRVFSFCAIVSLWLIFLFEGFSTKFTFMVAFTFFQGSLLPIVESTMISFSQRLLVPYSKIRIWGTIGYTITAFLGGRIVKFGFIWLFVVFCGILFLISLLSGHLRERIEGSRKKSAGRVPGNFILLFGIVTVCVGFNLFNSIFLPIVVRERAYDLSIVGTTLSLMALSELPFLFFAERIRKKLTTRILFITGAVVIGLRLVLVPLTQSAMGLVLVQMLHGWTFIVIYYSCIGLMRENLKDQQLLSTQALFWIALQGIGPLIGSTVGGIIVEKTGVFNAYLFFGLICLGMVIASIRFVMHRFSNLQKS
ncbi:MFS transporter [Pseudothermotoga sp. U03pept]|uniref:MFS transporter n=1 Tax=Pseudothermotoga sp. U03pept TaxID=3447012 RepID=UPI003F07D4BF